MAIVRKVRSTMSLSDARAVVDAAFDVALEMSLLPLGVVVLDSGAATVSAQRQDGASVMRTEIAHAKAWGALAMGLPTRAIAERLHDNPNFVSALSAISHGRFAPVPGGVLILDDSGAAIGAVGISGDTSDRDESCAVTALARAGLRSDPAAAET